MLGIIDEIEWYIARVAARRQELEEQVSDERRAALSKYRSRLVDVEEILESKTSVMPTGLTKQLKDRGQFNDLLKYILETRKR